MWQVASKAKVIVYTQYKGICIMTGAQVLEQKHTHILSDTRELDKVPTIT